MGAVRIRVLIVDDYRDCAEMTAEHLRFRPDIVISDLSMPGIDGYELVRRLRSRPYLFDGWIYVNTAIPREMVSGDKLYPYVDDIVIRPALEDIDRLVDAAKDFTAACERLQSVSAPPTGPSPVQ